MFISSFATRSESVYKCKSYNFAKFEVKMPIYHNQHCENIYLKRKLFQKTEIASDLVTTNLT